MGNKDTKKIYKNAITAYEMFADRMPPKKIKKFKAKERQDGKKQIKREIKNG